MFQCDVDPSFMSYLCWGHLSYHWYYYIKYKVILRLTVDHTVWHRIISAVFTDKNSAFVPHRTSAEQPLFVVSTHRVSGSDSLLLCSGNASSNANVGFLIYSAGDCSQTDKVFNKLLSCFCWSLHVEDFAEVKLTQFWSFCYIYLYN